MQRVVELHKLLQLKTILSDLSTFYPGFDRWFMEKVIPRCITGDGVAYVSEHNNKLSGIIIGKTGNEPKIQCVRVMPEFQGSGIGLRLIDRILLDLNTDKPLVTVPEEMIHGLSRPLVNRYHFSLDEVNKGMYRKGKLEYIFNSG